MSWEWECAASCLLEKLQYCLLNCCQVTDKCFSYVTTFYLQQIVGKHLWLSQVSFTYSQWEAGGASASSLNEALNCTSPSSSASDGGTRLRQFCLTRRRHCSSSVLPPAVRQQFKDACGDHFPPWSSHSKAIMSFPVISGSRRWSLSYSYKPVEALHYTALYCCRLCFENVIKQ